MLKHYFEQWKKKYNKKMSETPFIPMQFPFFTKN